MQKTIRNPQIFFYISEELIKRFLQIGYKMVYLTSLNKNYQFTTCKRSSFTALVIYK